MFSLSYPEIGPNLTNACFQMSQAFSEGLMRVARAVYRFVIENRMGFAFLVGLVVVPSQTMRRKGVEASAEADRIIKNPIAYQYQGQIGTFKTDKGLGGLIYYPKDLNKDTKDKCVLYHPPNAMTATEWFRYPIDENIPIQLAEALKCPIIVYDYQGTGLSDNRWATYETVVQDGEEAFRYACQELEFESVYSVGTSLGGGVSAKALERYLFSNKEDANKIKFISHNSFSSMPRVILPSCPRLADFLGWLIGASMNAVGAVKNLMEKDVQILVLSHKSDHLIGRGARLFDEVKDNNHNVKAFEDDEEALNNKHMYLTKPQLDKIEGFVGSA